MNDLKGTVKTTIDAMSLEELLYQIELGRKSPYQREKMAYIKSRYSSLKEQESSQRHRENIEVQKTIADANKPNSPLINTWWTVFGGFILACLLYIFRAHLGIPL